MTRCSLRTTSSPGWREEDTTAGPTPTRWRRPAMETSAVRAPASTARTVACARGGSWRALTSSCRAASSWRAALRALARWVFLRLSTPACSLSSRRRSVTSPPDWLPACTDWSREAPVSVCATGSLCSTGSSSMRVLLDCHPGPLRSPSIRVGTSVPICTRLVTRIHIHVAGGAAPTPTDLTPQPVEAPGSAVTESTHV